MMRTEPGHIGHVAGLRGLVGGVPDLPKDAPDEGFATFVDAPEAMQAEGEDSGPGLRTTPDAMVAWTMVVPAAAPLLLPLARMEQPGQAAADPAKEAVVVADDAAAMLAVDGRMAAGGEAQGESPISAFAEKAAAPDERLLPSSAQVGLSGAAALLTAADSALGKSSVLSAAAPPAQGAVKLPTAEGTSGAPGPAESSNGRASPLQAAGKSREGGAAPPVSVAGQGEHSRERATSALASGTGPAPTPVGGWPPVKAEGIVAPAASPATPPTSDEAIASHRPVLAPGPTDSPAGESEAPLTAKTAGGAAAASGLLLHAAIPASHLPSGTTAERAWLGLHAGDRGRGGGTEDAAPMLAESPPENARPIRADSGAGVPANVPRMADPALQTADADPASVQLDVELSPLGWSPAGQPPATANPSAGSLAPATVPHLAAGVVATLHRQATGTTEIALSPAELGGVRLRLEADAKDPDRMIVHLSFDRPETMELFRRHADQLSEAIRAAGYAEARLDFGQSGTGANTRGDGQAANGTDIPANLGERDHSHALPPPERPVSLRLAAIAGLDLRL